MLVEEVEVVVTDLEAQLQVGEAQVLVVVMLLEVLQL